MGIYVQLRRCCPAAKSSSMVDQSNILVFVGLFLRALDVQAIRCSSALRYGAFKVSGLSIAAGASPGSKALLEEP
eukprot:1988730-Pyramimonas_sp.AAC.2